MRATSHSIDISEDQYLALCDYAHAHGRTWKSHLLNDWLNGRADSFLQQLRNSHGPSWLVKFKFTK